MKQCQHKTQNLSYIAWDTDAEQRKKRGEKQIKCPVCKKYIWETLFKEQDKSQQLADMREIFEKYGIKCP